MAISLIRRKDSTVVPVGRNNKPAREYAQTLKAQAGIIPAPLALMHRALKEPAVTHDFDAVLLDFDGTLFDTAPDFVGALNALLAELELAPARLEDFRRLSGSGAKFLLARALTAQDAKYADSELQALVPRLLEHYYVRMTDETVPYAGVVETLETLRSAGIPLGICTNRGHKSTATLLAHFGLDRLFDTVLCGDQVAAKKPHADHLHEAATALGVAPSSVVMVGDTETDVAAARAACVPVVAVSYGYSPTPASALGADIVIDDFAGLPAALVTLSTKPA